MPEAALSLPARQDLRNIWEFIACDNTGAADRVLDAMFRAFERLASMPEIGARRKVPVPRLQGLRFWPVPGFHDYLIFYLPMEQQGVEIVRVLHRSRDIPTALAESS